jgi:hypothetical protein
LLCTKLHDLVSVITSLIYFIFYFILFTVDTSFRFQSSDVYMSVFLYNKLHVLVSMIISAEDGR